MSHKQPFVDEYVLQVWNEACEDEQHLEIIRLAHLGLWCEQHSMAIQDALSMVVSRMPASAITHFEKALDAKPRRNRQ